MQQTSAKLPLRASLLILVFISTLFACTSQPPPPARDAIHEVETIDDLDSLFHQARISESPKREQYLLLAIKKLRQNGEIEHAQQILLSIFYSSLPYPLKAQYIVEYAELALAFNQPQQALNALIGNQFNLYDYIDLLDRDSQSELSKIKARAYAHSQNYLASARERIFINPILPLQEQLENELQIWESLNQLPTQQLQSLTLNSTNIDLVAWSELAYLNKAYQDDIDKQYQQLKQWLERWPQHPAQQRLPSNLLLLSKYADLRPKHIALLLPMQGKFAKTARAIQDGIMAAHYTAISTGSSVPKITLYDTNNNNIELLYQQAVNEGAELVIGPLEKENVQTLLLKPNPEIPVLALNYSQSDMETKNVFQFGLLPEDEAKQVALRAWQQGHRNVALFAPQSDWGNRVSQAFRHYWQQMGGNIVAQQSFNPQLGYSQAIKNLLNIDKSEQRANALRRLLNTNFEFTVRRRDDIDFIFLLATPKQARQIKPTLAFYYAGDIPVYATSHIYEGDSANSEQNRDLNGVVFCDLPWNFSGDDPVKINSSVAWPNQHSRYNRLFALGVDSYRLHSRLAILAAAPGSKVFGATGVLELSEQNRIQRTLIWAQIINGKAEMIRTQSSLQPSPPPSKPETRTLHHAG